MTARALRLATTCALVLHAGVALAEPPPITADLGDLPLYGVKDGLVYLRDPRDLVRLYPHAQLDLDAHAYFGKQVDTLGASEAGVDLGTRFFVRRARFDMGGELFERIGFDVGLDLVAHPAIDGARVDRDTKVALADAWVNLDAGRGLSAMIGVFQAPFSLENRSETSDLPMMERNMAIRFAVPSGKALGVAVGGAAHHEWLRWDLGVFGAESVSPGEFERHADAIGRVVIRPWAGSLGSALRGVQVGFSARGGSRQPRDVSGDTAALTTGQGYALWRPTRTDVFGRTLHVIPSDRQLAAGGELRIPVHSFVVRGEAYGIWRRTREAVEGYQATNSERFGSLDGLAWYGELSCWPLQLAKLIGGEPPELGKHPHPDHLELARAYRRAERYGLELAFLVGGVNATYDGASRMGAPEPTVRSTRLEVYQLGAAVNYWHTSHLRFSLNGNLYEAPASGGKDNLADVPGNLGGRSPDAHALWETGARVTALF